MNYLVTGASGFIGKRLVRALLARPGSKVYVVLREPSGEKLEKLKEFWGAEADRAIPIKGDITEPGLGIAKGDLKMLKGKISHFFHLAAIYDLAADPKKEIETNVGGTRNAVELAKAIGAKHFHHMSSIAAAGLYEGVFREDMLEEARNLDHPYFKSKHQAEKVVRKECQVPWRIYRPGIVVGDSQTGEIDKIDGPYYFFKLIQRLRKALPPWMPGIGIEGGRINLVPVDFVVEALVHIAHAAGQDRRCFHLTDPNPKRVGDVLAILARAAHAPDLNMRVNAALLNLIPPALVQGLTSLAPVQRIRDAVMKDLGLPPGILAFVNYPTRFDAREAQRLLEPAGIRVPPFEDYAWKLWDYWERNLDPDLLIDRSLRARVAGRVVVVTGGSSGIGKATAARLAEAGAITVIVARDPAKLAETRAELAANGLTVHTYTADIADAEQCAAFAKSLLDDHGGADILINNAGRSIRRGIEASFDRMHDYERTMSVNYFGAVRLSLALLPGMSAKGRGHIINISSIGVLTSAPRFSAYVASKAALEAWTRCAAAEFLDRGLHFTIVNLPLVKTPMIAPTKLYEHVPTLTPEEAAGLIIEAIVKRPVRVATRLGIFGQVMNAALPRVAQIINNTLYRMFPDSAAAKGQAGEEDAPTSDQLAFTQLMRGIHL